MKSCEHGSLIPLHSTLDDWSGNMNDISTSINRIASENGMHAHPYAEEFGESCGYHLQ